jgi:hypothetical protein
VYPENRITVDQGKAFFAKIAELGNLASRGAFKANKDTFDLIDKCCYFVYLVRNNIFHGAKTIGEIYDSDQARRIGVYDLFVRCLNSLFFLACGKKNHGAGVAQLPIVLNIGDEKKELAIQHVYGLIQRKLLKPEDSMLHLRMSQTLQDIPILSAQNRRSLFYPSAGRDFFFPLLVGLPFCTDFFFYEQNRHRDALPKLRDAIGVFGRDILCHDIDGRDREGIEFEFDSVVRRAWIVHEDNMTFLENKIPLGFYFRRGDSGEDGGGEGGSGQRWDSDLLPQLLALSDPADGCRILSDGAPGNLRKDIASKCKRISLPSSHRGRDYFYGVIR